MFVRPAGVKTPVFVCSTAWDLVKANKSTKAGNRLDKAEWV
jgi:hypothetical protein